MLKPISLLKIIFISQLLLSTAFPAILKIQPYAQWTFDTPIESVVYRNSGNGFPIKLLVNEQFITPYDSLGNRIREIKRSAGDMFVSNANYTGFMLVQKKVSSYADQGETIYSFQVYDFEGNPQYTFVKGVPLVGGELIYQITSQGSILFTERGTAAIKEVYGEHTLMEIASCKSENNGEGIPYTLATKLKLRNEVVTAVSCMVQDDTASVELRLWNDDNVLGTPLNLSGSIESIHNLASTDYFFLEISQGADRRLTLFNRMQAIQSYPWESWKIDLVDSKTAFVITSKDFSLINLGDGSATVNYHPIDLSTISDALYLPQWGIFLYIRYEAYYTEDGRQAFRNFQLEGVNRAGQIIHRSSFGTWTYSLPKIANIGKDLFGIHIHNSVLMYGIRLEKE